MKIYTKKGDYRQTGLFSGKRVGKHDKLIEAIGTIDALNAQIGVIKEERIRLQKIQNDLFAIGSKLAGYETRLNLDKRVEEMEAEIDLMWAKLPPLKNFVLPRGQLHLARTVARRAERAAVAAKGKFAWQYLNRLGDYLFCLARWVNYKAKIKETVWRSS